MDGYQVWMAASMMPKTETPQTLLLLSVDGLPGGDLSSLPPEGMLCRVVGAMLPSQPQQNVIAAADPPDSAERRITRLLTAIGIPSNLLGFAYLRAALLLVMSEPELGKQLTTRLYPRIAAQFSVAARSVERAIRHAIQLAWERGSSEGYQRALGRLGSSVGDRPTNSEFLAQTAECIRIGAFS